MLDLTPLDPESKQPSRRSFQIFSMLPSPPPLSSFSVIIPSKDKLPLLLNVLVVDCLLFSLEYYMHQL